MKRIHNPDILTCISSLRSAEVFTPPKVVNNILDQLPEDIWENMMKSIGLENAEIISHAAQA